MLKVLRQGGPSVSPSKCILHRGGLVSGAQPTVQGTPRIVFSHHCYPPVKNPVWRGRNCGYPGPLNSSCNPPLRLDGCDSLFRWEHLHLRLRVQRFGWNIIPSGLLGRRNDGRLAGIQNDTFGPSLRRVHPVHLRVSKKNGSDVRRPVPVVRNSCRQKRSNGLRAPVNHSELGRPWPFLPRCRYDVRSALQFPAAAALVAEVFPSVGFS
jgi:hypothetical protein